MTDLYGGGGEHGGVTDLYGGGGGHGGVTDLYGGGGGHGGVTDLYGGGGGHCGVTDLYGGGGGHGGVTDLYGGGGGHGGVTDLYGGRRGHRRDPVRLQVDVADAAGHVEPAVHPLRPPHPAAHQPPPRRLHPPPLRRVGGAVGGGEAEGRATATQHRRRVAYVRDGEVTAGTQQADGGRRAVSGADS